MSFQICELPPSTLDRITSYLPYSSVVALIFIGSKRLIERLVFAGGVTCVDYGYALPLFAQAHPQTWAFPRIPESIPSPQEPVSATFRKGQFKHVQHLTLPLPSQKANELVALSDLPSTLTSLILELATWPTPKWYKNNDWEAALPALKSLAIAFGVLGPETLNDPPSVDHFFKGLPRHLQTLKFCYLGQLSQIFLPKNSLPSLTCLDFSLGKEAPSMDAYHALVLGSGEFAVELPSTITDLRLQDYSLSPQSGWGWKNLTALSRLHLKVVDPKARQLIPATVTHLELLGEAQEGPISEGWRANMSTLKIAASRSFLFTAKDQDRSPAILPSSVTHLIEFNFGGAVFSIYSHTGMMHYFGDIDRPKEPFFAQHLTRIDLSTKIFAESLLLDLVRCTWLRRITLYDVLLCGVSIPPNATSVHDMDDVRRWFWQYWASRLPLTVWSPTPLSKWTNSLALTLSSRNAQLLPKHPLPETLTSLTVNGHGFGFDRLPASITEAHAISVLGPFSKPLPNLKVLKLVLHPKNDKAGPEEPLDLEKLMTLTPNLTALDGAWIKVSSKFLDKHARTMHEKLYKASTASPRIPKPFVEAQEDEEPADGYATCLALSPSSVASSSASAASGTSGAGSKATSSSAPAADSSAIDLPQLDALRIPGDFRLLTIGVSPVKLTNANLAVRDILADLSEPLPVFDRYEFTLGKLVASDFFFKGGIPHGVVDVDLTHVELVDSNQIVRMPQLPNSVTSLAFGGPLAVEFLFEPKKMLIGLERTDFSWIPESVKTLYVSASQPWGNWTLLELPPNLTCLIIDSPQRVITSKDTKALPKHLSNIVISDFQMRMTATIDEKKMSKQDKEKCTIS